MSNKSYSIAAEKPSDLSHIEQLLDDAFGLDRRIKTAYRLREGSQPVDGLSFVARLGDTLVGTIRFWPLRVAGRWSSLLLGPLAIQPDFRGYGCGIALMEKGLETASQLGHERVILVGDEPYYSRVGFVRAKQGMLSLPGPVDPNRVLYRELVDGAMNGVSGLVMSPVRSTALTEPGEAEQTQDGC